ncbi:MAG TPA: response regulator transcription factor [Thermoanaerobaculaceae bacterium]|nr:response regulator transcription factor [Thermoanaerobaculaceae bacterium]HPS77543.1 response regulator transcription factor [Thermoanaerobaculaceae bacterium]
MRVLLVEDDLRLRDVIARNIERLALACDTASSLAEADELMALHAYDLLVLDRRLPDGDGLDLCRTARQQGFGNSILMLTALHDPQSTVEGLADGADDYLGKPFDLEVLQARVKALLRRNQRRPAEELCRGELRLDPWKRELRWQGRPVSVTARELAILEALLRADGGVTSREDLMEQAWGEREEPMSNTIDVLVSRVRRKLEAAGASVRVESVRGLGYRLE